MTPSSMMKPLRAFAILLALSGLAACATTERLSAANDVRALLVAIRDGDHAAFDAHVDRRALEAQIQSMLVAEAKNSNLADGVKSLGVLFSGTAAHLASRLFIQPEVFRAVADYYGYKPGTPIPSTLTLAAVLKPIAGDRVCATQGHSGPCLITFAEEDGVWRLVSFDGDVAMLRLKGR